jgi:lysophospholipase
MYKRSETFFNGDDGTQLFLQKWIKADAIGTILITHGQAEHSDCYLRLINALENEKWNFIAWDLRGHGRSAGIRGFANDFNEYVSDYQIFIEKSLQLAEVKNKPVVILAHSMGGLIQTCALLDNVDTRISAQILSSPMFGVAVDVPVWKDAGAGILNSFFPKVTLGNEIKADNLTRDPEIMREYEQDTYRHNRISSGVYLGFKREFPKVLSRASEISLPTLMHISDNDPVVSSPIALQFFDQLGGSLKTLKIIEDAKHELYNDTIRKDVFKIVIEFLASLNLNP